MCVHCSILYSCRYYHTGALFMRHLDILSSTFAHPDTMYRLERDKYLNRHRVVEVLEFHPFNVRISAFARVGWFLKQHAQTILNLLLCTKSDTLTVPSLTVHSPFLISSLAFLFLKITPHINLIIILCDVSRRRISSTLIGHVSFQTVWSW
jgi:hypothetical protein